MVDGEGGSPVRRLVCFLPQAFLRLLSELHDTYGTAGDAMLFEMSKNYGIGIVDIWRKTLGMAENDQSTGEFLDAFISNMGSQGWGEIDLKTSNPTNGDFKIEIRGNPFTEQCDRSASLTQCIFYRGASLGVLSELSNQELLVDKHECLGDEKTCHISLRRN